MNTRLTDSAPMYAVPTGYIKTPFVTFTNVCAVNNVVTNVCHVWYHVTKYIKPDNIVKGSLYSSSFEREME